jgi:WD40 repeat protein
VVSTGSDGTVRLWSLSDGTADVLHTGKGWMVDVAFSSDAERLAAVGDDGFVYRWNMRTRRALPPTRGSQSPLKSVAFSPDGHRFAAGGVDGNVLVWAAAGGSPVASLRGEGPWVYEVACGRTGDDVVSAMDDGRCGRSRELTPRSCSAHPAPPAS